MNYKPDTELLYCGTGEQSGARNPEVPPLYAATAFILRDTADYAAANSGGKYFYSRFANPNRDGLAQAISYLEHGAGTLLCSSGMAAISTVLLGLLRAGDHILMSRAVYGETIELARDLLPGFNIEVSYADFTDMERVRAKISAKTRLLYTEVISNPLTSVVDINALCDIAHRAGALVAVDSTFTTPFAIRPLEHGADVVIHSLTKFFGGHSDITGGSVTASAEIIARLRHKYLLLGCCMDPNTAWLALRSIKTLGLRIRTQMANAGKLAAALAAVPCVRRVYYPGLATHPQHALAERLLDDGFGAVLSFRVEDSIGKVNAFMRRLRLAKYLGTLGGVRTTYTHPATALAQEFTKQELKDIGITDGLIRISAGIEDIEDLIADFIQALIVFNA